MSGGQEPLGCDTPPAGKNPPHPQPDYHSLLDANCQDESVRKNLRPVGGKVFERPALLCNITQFCLPADDEKRRKYPAHRPGTTARGQGRRSRIPTTTCDQTEEWGSHTNDEGCPSRCAATILFQRNGMIARPRTRTASWRQRRPPPQSRIRQCVDNLTLSGHIQRGEREQKSSAGRMNSGPASRGLVCHNPSRTCVRSRMLSPMESLAFPTLLNRPCSTCPPCRCL